MQDQDLRRRTLARAAVKIHQHLAGPAQLPPLPPVPSLRWDNLSRLAQRFELVRAKGWYAAAQAVRRDVYYELRRLHSELEEYQEALPALVPQGTIASPSEIAADLAALCEEFDEATIDLEEKTISILTQPIRLEEVALGRFKIVLNWDQIGQKRAYEALAEDPNRPEYDDEVTHPHVRNGVLCEGDGAIAIKSALLQGRLLDFFLLVQNVLSTYNGASAYVAIERWHGATCADCGYELDSDHGACERCEVALCGECSALCSICDRYLCADCLRECSSCNGSFCRSCLHDGPESTLFCETCLERKNPDDEGDPTIPGENEDAIPVLEADALCLVETAVPA